MKQILNTKGEEVSKKISDKLEECYNKLAGNGLIDSDITWLRGMINAYEDSLTMIGRTHEVRVTIKEVGN